MKRTLSVLFLGLLICSFGPLGCSGSGSDDVTFGPKPTPSGTPSADDDDDSSGSGKVWTLEEIRTEPRTGGAGGAARCGGEFGFRRCVCVPDVPSSVRYRPAVAECNGNAAIILYDEYEDAFSVVVRDSQNRDRWPESGFNGCSLELATSDNPPNRCSAFKVQESFPLFPGGGAKVNCLGASGYSELFADVTRLTIKITDDPFSSDDEIDRICLSGGDIPLN